MESRILNRGALLNHGNIKGREIMFQIMDTALRASDPYFNTKKLVRLEGDRLIFDGPDFEAQGDPNAGPTVFDLSKIDRVYVLTGFPDNPGSYEVPPEW